MLRCAELDPATLQLVGSPDLTSPGWDVAEQGEDPPSPRLSSLCRTVPLPCPLTNHSRQSGAAIDCILVFKLTGPKREPGWGRGANTLKIRELEGPPTETGRTPAGF